jgi:hypothetical protein
MKTATTEFLNLQAKHNLQYYKEINLYSRYWDPGTTSYKWDTTPVELKPYLQSISNLNWQLDTEGLNIWRISNLTLTLKNTNNEFTPAHTDGLFESKELHKSKLEIKIGYKNSSGTTYTIEIFNGIIVNDPSFDCLSKLVTLYISGLEVLTQEGDAEKVSINVSDEVIGTGTGEDSQTFYTANNGVGKIIDVKAGGTLQLQGIDYNVSNLNAPSGSAHINFIPAPPSPLSVTSSYIYWKSNISIKSLVEDLLQEASFNPGEYSIEEGLFYYGDKTEVWNKKPELEDSIRSRNIDTASSPGYVLQKKEDFTSDVNLDGLNLDGSNHIYLPYFNNKYECNDLPENAVPQWSTWGGFVSTFNREITSSQYHNWGRVIGNSGDWQKERQDYRDTDKTTSLLIRCKMDVTIVLNGMSNPDTAYIRVTISNGSYTTWFRIKQYRHTFLNWKQVELGGAAPITFDISTYHTYWIVMNGSAVDLYIDNVKTLSSTASPTTENKVDIYQYGGEYNSGREWDFESFIDYVYWTPESIRPDGSGDIEGIAESSGLDFAVAPPYYGKIFRAHSIPGSYSITYETQVSGTSDFSSDNDSWREVSWAGDVGSIHASTVKKRYLRWRATFTGPVTGADSPEITELTMPGSVLFNTTDCSTDLQEYRSYECWNTLNSQEIKLYSMSSADDITYDNEEEIIGITISSAVKRYMKFRNIISKIVSGNTAIIYRDKFIYRIKSINVLMANFSNQTCQKAIENLASLLDFELGITGEGIYFFRSKSIGGTVKWIFQRGKDLVNVKSIKPGWDRIKNLVISQYGEYYESSDKFLADDPRPNSQDTYGKRFEKLGETGAYVDPTMNVAIGQVETYFKNHKESKKEVIIDTKVIPQLDLADKVQVDSDGLTGVDFKVVGINLDINNWGMEIILWEI